MFTSSRWSSCALTDIISLAPAQSFDTDQYMLQQNYIVDNNAGVNNLFPPNFLDGLNLSFMTTPVGCYDNFVQQSSIKSYQNSITLIW